MGWMSRLKSIGAAVVVAPAKMRVQPSARRGSNGEETRGRKTDIGQH
jgi:hypothetical protein